MALEAHIELGILLDIPTVIIAEVDLAH